MSQQPPPPPPPPHGDNPKSTNTSGIKYDVFVIPDTGSGFLYLPSLQPNINSFVAGFACALALVVLGQSLAPAIRLWWNSFQGMGNMGVVLLLVAVGLGAWSLGRQHPDGPGGPGGAGSTSGDGARAGTGSAPPPPQQPNAGPPPHSPPPHTETPGGAKPGTSWGAPRSAPAGAARADSSGTPKNAWEKAREETRKREEERKAKEADEKRREEAARRLKELREKEAREREQREKEVREREAREREAREKARKEKEREEEERNRRKGSTYAYSGVGERTSPWPSGKPAAAATTPASAQSAPPPTQARAGASSPATPTKRPPAPTARTYLGTEEETYSFRPYDKPKQAPRKKSFSDLSETSWAPSQSTARTTPPPSARAPYSTKDPDKIVIKAVYAFVNQFAKTPASQLISGTGAVTDGLILRITTEGLFIDDDVRGVAQREWDVKAWTLKLVEVWCPQHSATLASSGGASETLPPGASARNGNANGNSHNGFFFKTMGGGARVRAGERGSPKTLTGDEADAYLTDLLRACKNCCRLGLCSASAAASSSSSSSSSSSASGASRSSTTSSNTDHHRHHKTGEWKAQGLHLLRATIRDQEGKRYLFVVAEEESWKVAVGLQRLRRGTQVRAMGVAGLSGLETKNTLEMLGWGRRQGEGEEGEGAFFSSGALR